MKKLTALCLAVFMTVILISLSSCAGKSDIDLKEQTSGMRTTDTENPTTITESPADLTEDTTTAETTEASETVSDEVPSDAFEMPDQSFIGLWATDEYSTNEILIYEITSEGVKFNTGIHREFGFNATAVVVDGGLAFGDGISPGYSGPVGIRGRLVFGDTSITVIYDDFGAFNPAGGVDTYVFTIKDEDSERYVENYKAVKGY
ncbi:MAG: hypothetical protein E7578_06030 [Ruminococcaceae bacterium]|nr:hypothetical protein [Oscillospiraceae bacterium]